MVPMIQADTHAITLRAPAATPRPLLSPVDGVPMADSRNVAAMFGKRHNNVMRDIRGLLGSEQALAGRYFREATYVDPQNGQAYPHYLMDRDGFALLAMGFTGARATRWKLAYIEAFNGMEAELRKRQAPAFDPNDPASLRTMLLGYAEQLIEARAERDEARTEAAIAHQVIEHQAPAVEAYEHLLDDSGTCCLADAARVLGIEQRAFFVWIRKAGYVFDKGEALLPRADLRKDGRFRVRLVRTRPGEHREQTLVTRQGMIWLSHRWAAKLAVDAREAAAARIQATLDL